MGAAARAPESAETAPTWSAGSAGGLRASRRHEGRAKIAIALGRGKKLHDKRETEKARDWSRDKSRLMRERG